MLNFQAVLTNVKFDIDCRNVLYFENREAQENYFSVASLFSSAQSINFNAGSLIETTIIYQVQGNETLNEILSKNYCIIKDNNVNATIKYYYYFVKNIMQDSGNQVKVWLELDIFQTYFIDVNFSDCEILRAHLNRFVENSDGTVSFDGGIESQLFEREDIKNVAKRLVKRTKLQQLKPYPSDPTNPNYEKNKKITDWLNENVYAYVYIFCDPTHQYNIIDNNRTKIQKQFSSLNIGTTHKQTYQIDKNSGINTNLVCFCFPITKDDYSIQIGESNNVWSFKSFEDFLKTNEQFSYIYSIKMSALPPFTLFETGGAGVSGTIVNEKTLLLDAEKEEPGLAISGFGLDYGTLAIRFKYEATSPIGDPNSVLVLIEKQIANISTIYESDVKMTFVKSEIINAKKSPIFNPKLLNSDYKDLKILAGMSSEGFSYDFQKVNKTNLNVEISEPLLPDISRVYARFAGLDGVYIEDTSKNFTGDIEQTDLNLNMATEKFKDFLANNKNFFLQNVVNRQNMGINAFLSGAKNLAGAAGAANPISAALGVGGALLGGIGAAANIGFNKINENLTVDNMKNAPGILKIASGSGYLLAMVDKIGVFIEEYDILPNEKTIVNDYMCQYGYTVNRIGNLKNYLNTRKYYNYIQADIQETGGVNISKAVHDKFKNMFARGVRFWNVDSFCYELENYEKWLEA